MYTKIILKNVEINKLLFFSVVWKTHICYTVEFHIRQTSVNSCMSVFVDDRGVMRTDWQISGAGEELHHNDKSFHVFDKLYEENKGNILIDFTHPISQEAILDWFSALRNSDATLQALGRIVAVGLQHISFAEFYETLLHQAHEALQMCVDDKCHLVLFIDGEIEKSNLWTALLIWPVIRSRVAAVVDAGSFQDWYDNNNNDQRYHVVHVDDGSFSGQQIRGVLNTLNIEDKIRQRAGNLVWIFVVPALSDKALSTIGDGLDFVRFPITFIKLHTFGYITAEIFKRQYGSAWRVSYDRFFDAVQGHKYKDIYQVSPEICMAYFDHKLPDRVSTITKIIAFAPAIDELDDERISQRSLIQGCDVSVYTVNGNPVDLEDFVGQFDNDGTCPESFYKNIYYEYDGAPIDTLLTFSEFVASEEE
jgi:hypothetical protein